MRLFEVAAWQHELVPGVPVRLEPESIVVPENAEVRFVAMEHGDDSDTEYFEDIFHDTDIFFPEINGWDALTAKMLQKVSRGDYDARQRMLQGSSSNSRGFAERLTRAMYNTRVNVRMADLPEKSPIPAKLSRTGYDENGDLAREGFPLMVERDRHIARTIGAELVAAQSENPRLKDRTVRATALFGVGHFEVPAALNEAARLHGVDTFSASLLFDPAAAAGTSQAIIDYGNWLRTPEEQSS